MRKSPFTEDKIAFRGSAGRARDGGGGAVPQDGASASRLMAMRAPTLRLSAAIILARQRTPGTPFGRAPFAFRDPILPHAIPGEDGCYQHDRPILLEIHETLSCSPECDTRTRPRRLSDRLMRLNGA